MKCVKFSKSKKISVTYIWNNFTKIELFVYKIEVKTPNQTLLLT